MSSPGYPPASQMYRAALALIGGDPAGTLVHARLAAARAPEHDDLTLASAAALAGLASWTLGDLEAAHRSYADAADGLRKVGYIADVLGCSITLADIESTQGKLSQAQRTYEHALDLAGEHDPGMRGTRDMYVGLSQVALERNDLACRHRTSAALRRARRAGRPAPEPLPVASGAGTAPRGRGRPRCRARAACGGGTGVRRPTSRRTCDRSRRCAHGCSRRTVS